jgi:hypothetical protein
VAKNWIKSAVQNKGALREELGTPAGKKISTSKLKEAEKSKNPTTRKRAVLAETLKKFHKK